MTRDQHQRELRRSMHGKTAVIPYTTFMNSFVPDPRDSTEPLGHPCSTDVFKGMTKPKNEKEMYREIPKRLNSEELLRGGFVVVSTPHKAGCAPSSNITPLCGIYPHDHAPEIKDASQYSLTDWSHLEITVECMPNFAADPFVHKASANAERSAEARKSALGQILSHAELVLQNQHRKHHFMIIFFGTLARIVYIDRDCMFATQRFSYVKKEAWLTEFLWRYGKLAPVQRGFDPSAQRLDPTEPLVQLMRQKRDAAVNGETPVEPHILEAYKDSLDDKVPWWKLDVYDEDEDFSRSFVVGKPHYLASGVLGRGTRCYIAQEVLKDDQGQFKLGAFMHMKDAWRVKHDEIEKEGTTLKTLNENNVPHVPTLVCHGDLPDQLTVSRAKWMEFNPGQDYYPIKEHQHYRIVVQEIGKPLSQFKNSRELVRALADVVQAHEAAYNCGFIHRDLSGGNILLCIDSKGNWRGLLTDWELAKNILTTSHERQTERTGTWQFMSAHVQDNPRHVVCIADELESIFHILIFYTVRFCPHNIPDDNIGQFLYEYFDIRPWCARGTCSARAKQEAVDLGTIEIRTQKGFRALQFIWQKKSPDANGAYPRYRHPLNDIISKLLSWFQAHYALDTIQNAELKAKAKAKVPSLDLLKHRRVDWGENEDDPSDSESSGGSDEDSDEDSDYDTLREEDIERTKKQAAKLATHYAMRRLLRNALQKGKRWPGEHEKTADKRPKDGYHNPQSVVPIVFFGPKDDEPGQDESQELSGAPKNPSVPSVDDAEWVEPEEGVGNEPAGTRAAEDSHAEGNLVEDDHSFAADINGLSRGVALPQHQMPNSPPPRSNMRTCNNKRTHDDSPEEPTTSTTPTKRRRIID
ncbi:hypothetical protein L226DRAFT_163652 [Lentinus tigrinus ALCF2SS1-7]|uniref:Fungal-type protein kinase domain-containing protein n=1 Tax=Lentinus tigrinus ALCF2SS1-6 TaxID=1328759 RepID=A0A5C2S2S0_9APHY|nr:hypothetical protein L227DRAFT_551716 [Lentinus tigrinus ALCF2SS1-6]RPD71857.1 hypothetical protein L226DRAFT_163652 [Lentinus tigrinus ALCF2SS1-7]